MSSSKKVTVSVLLFMLHGRFPMSVHYSLAIGQILPETVFVVVPLQYIHLSFLGLLTFLASLPENPFS
jgi:hypothetical protein